MKYFGFDTPRGGIHRLAIAAAFVLLLTASSAAEQAGRRYYSIHLASFKYLENANRQINALQQKEKLLFWKKIDIPGRGEFFRVFLGRYESWEEAVSCWEKLHREGAVRYFGIYEFEEPRIPPEAPAAAPVRPAPAVQAAAPEIRAPAPEKRFIDNRDGTVTDTLTGLMWVQNGWRLDFVAALTWPEAIEKCREFKLGGYNDWRLSTVAEWQSLIDPTRQAPALVEPNPFENIIVHMPYWAQSEFDVAGRGLKPGHSSRAYTVMLYSGNIFHQKKSDRAFVLPVRETR